MCAFQKHLKQCLLIHEMHIAPRFYSHLSMKLRASHKKEGSKRETYYIIHALVLTKHLIFIYSNTFKVQISQRE